MLMKYVCTAAQQREFITLQHFKFFFGNAIIYWFMHQLCLMLRYKVLATSQANHYTMTQELIVSFSLFTSKWTSVQNIARHTWIGRSHKLVTFSLIVLLWALSKMSPLTEGIMAPGEFLPPLKNNNKWKSHQTARFVLRLRSLFGFFFFNKTSPIAMQVH